MVRIANRIKQTHTALAAAQNETGTGPVDGHGAPIVVMYVRFGAGTSAGTVQLQASPVTVDGGGVQASDANWANVGAAVAWAAAGTLKYVAVAEPHRYYRAKVTVAVAGGVIDVWIVTGGFASGSFLELG